MWSQLEQDETGKFIPLPLSSPKQKTPNQDSKPWESIESIIGRFATPATEREQEAIKLLSEIESLGRKKAAVRQTIIEYQQYKNDMPINRNTMDRKKVFEINEEIGIYNERYQSIDEGIEPLKTRLFNVMLDIRETVNSDSARIALMQRIKRAAE